MGFMLHEKRWWTLFLRPMELSSSTERYFQIGREISS